MQQPSSSSPIDHWLSAAAPDADIRILSADGTRREDSELAPGVTRVLAENYFSDDATAELFRICQTWAPDRILSNAEDDVMRVAEARTLFGVAGQRSASAVRFRDKVQMKQLFLDAGLEIVPFFPVQCVDDVLNAVESLGTVVLKPRRGSGSCGVHVINDASETRRICSGNPDVIRDIAEGALMAEKYIEGDVYHVDIALRDEEMLLVSPSRYLAPPHLFRQVNVASAMLDAATDDYDALVGAAGSLVSEVAGTGVSILHLEMYKDVEGRFLAGEVACRLGGGLIKESIRHAYGVDMSRTSYLLSAGLGSEIVPAARALTLTGFVLWTATRPPEDMIPAEWTLKYYCSGREGEPTYSGDAAAAGVVQGGSHQEVVDRINRLQSVPTVR